MQIYFPDYFKAQIKKLSRKYPHVKEDCIHAFSHFSPESAVHIHGNIYKLRIGSTDQQKGKRGGFRTYTFFILKKNAVVPICIFAKASAEDISQNELAYHVDKVISQLLFQELGMR